MTTLERSEAALFFEHGCPHSYLLFAALRRLQEERTLALRFRPLPMSELGPLASAAERDMHAAYRDASWPEIRERAARELGLALRRPDWGQDSRPAARASHWARAADPAREADFHEAVFAAYFQRGEAIEERPVLEACARAAGLEPEGLAASLAGGACEGALSADRDAARARGVAFVPALLVGGHVLAGARSPALLARALDELALAESLAAAAS